MTDEESVSGRLRGANWTFAGIFGLLAITALSVVPLTVTIHHLGQSSAMVIDIAGQQRMLLERYMKEVLLASDGVSVPYQKTRGLLIQRLNALISGGTTAAMIDPGETIVLPPSPSGEIRAALLEQQRLLERFVVNADLFLRTPRAAVEFAGRRESVLADNAMLLQVSNEAVAMLARHSEARVRALIGWEVIVVVLIVALALARTWQYMQVERSLRRSQATAMRALQQSDAVKSSLLSSVSHELRTPLTAIKSMLFNLQENPAGQPDHVREEFLRGIDDEVDYLDRLVGNLLDMSRLEAGVLAPNREWHVVEELVEAAVRRVGRRLGCRTLHIDLPPGLPPVYVDGVAIQQVFVNLLDNAVKFSPRDTPISLRAAMKKEMVEVIVMNQGAGIPTGDLELVFERFYRVNAPPPRTIPGTGLGLAICKGIIEAHGGRIAASSIPGRETSIRFELPVATPAPVGALGEAHGRTR